ncbi:ComEA family DNA-binding protein [Mumia zhuanghuii]|nr:ComEA family DNA-binding protein [Mumia zhuanghuii]
MAADRVLAGRPRPDHPYDESADDLDLADDDLADLELAGHDPAGQDPAGQDPAEQDTAELDEDDPRALLWPEGLLPPSALPDRGGLQRRRTPRQPQAVEPDASGGVGRWGRHRSGSAGGAPPPPGGALPRRLAVLGEGVTSRHVVAVLVIVLAASVGVGWWTLRAQPRSVVAEPMPSAAVAGEGTVESPGQHAATATAAPGAPGAPATQVVVDVAGKVRRPGIVALPHGSRVVDALDAAGGARRGVDLTPLNLARVLVDGEQIVVGLPAVSGLPAASQPSAGGGASAAPAAAVSLNTATMEQLDTLPGVGPVTAQAILDWRTEHGRFTSVDELLEVRGIGDATLARLRDLVTL